ncbi:30S ribosomal protein S8e [Candidatus Pacearchaeota archaeon]|nr:30S ribosomal protein S8e [Candidatus Pacearchaeota archaeon]
MGYGRKITGGKYKFFRKRKKYAIQSVPRKVKLRTTKKKIIRGLGGNTRTVLLSAEYANVLNTNTNKTKKAKILNVVETAADRFLARQNILIKSAIIETELGKAKITNRPSQEGQVNAVLIK